MKKFILPIFLLGILLVSGLASAGFEDVEFTTPLSGEVVSGTLDIVWTDEGVGIDFLTLCEADCETGCNSLSASIPAGTLFKNWNSSSVSDGEFCLKLEKGTLLIESGIFYVNNSNPSCNGFISPTINDSAVGLEVLFNYNATIVGSETLIYHWDFGDGEEADGNGVTHTFDESDDFTIEVIVEDGNQGTCTDSIILEVKDAIIIPDQEVVALSNLTTDFDNETESYNGANVNTFTTSFIAPICTEMLASDMTIVANGNDCEVTWDNVVNADQGNNNPMFVRVIAGTNVEYYYFNTIVYSWKIDLVEGWNLISIPLIPTDPNTGEVDTAVDNVFGSIVDSVSYSSSEWSIYQAGTSSHTRPLSARTGYYDSTLDNIVPGYAYWVNMDVADSLYGFGDKVGPAPFGSSPTVELESGYNWIGKFGLKNTWLPKEIKNLMFSSAPGLKNLKDYQVDDENGNDVTTLKSGKGYQVFLGGNAGESILYTKSVTDYNFA